MDRFRACLVQTHPVEAVSYWWEAAGKPGKSHTSLSASLHEVIWKLDTTQSGQSRKNGGEDEDDDGDDDKT